MIDVALTFVGFAAGVVVVVPRVPWTPEARELRREQRALRAMGRVRCVGRWLP